jgi:hypothetical protein
VHCSVSAFLGSFSSAGSALVFSVYAVAVGGMGGDVGAGIAFAIVGADGVAPGSGLATGVMLTSGLVVVDGA